jgi:hypothetical protein
MGSPPSNPVDARSTRPPTRAVIFPPDLWPYQAFLARVGVRCFLLLFFGGPALSFIIQAEPVRDITRLIRVRKAKESMGPRAIHIECISSDCPFFFALGRGAYGVCCLYYRFVRPPFLCLSFRRVAAITLYPSSLGSSPSALSTFVFRFIGSPLTQGPRHTVFL